MKNDLYTLYLNLTGDELAFLANALMVQCDGESEAIVKPILSQMAEPLLEYKQAAQTSGIESENK